MASWLIYVKERFPIPVYLLLVGGISLSGNYLATGQFSARPFAMALVGNMIFFFVLRLMDELKDYQKDLVVHPARPLPRGLLQLPQVAGAINGIMLSMLAYGAVLGVLISWTVALNYWVIAGWVWLMYKEFYTNGWLADRPLLYAITHQVILLPVCSLAVIVHRPEMISMPATWIYGTVVLGSFFAYEVCRKLDPKAHELHQKCQSYTTYLVTYGPWKTFAIVVVLNAIAGLAAALSGTKSLLWPFELLTLVAFLVVIKKPEKYKLGEGAATLSLLFHIWCITFLHFWYFGFGS